MMIGIEMATLDGKAEPGEFQDMRLIMRLDFFQLNSNLPHK